MYDDADQDVEEFFGHDQKHQEDQEAQVAQPKSSKKRKHKADKATNADAKAEKVKAQHEEDQELRKRARFLCASPEQYRIVAKYGTQKLKEWVQDKEFEQKKALAQTVFDAVHRILAVGLDKITQGDGFVESQILADLTLRQSIEEEGIEYLSLLQNKVRILVLSFVDTVNAKRIQWQAEGVGGGGRGGCSIVEETSQSGDSSTSQAPQEAEDGEDLEGNY